MDGKNKLLREWNCFHHPQHNLGISFLHLPQLIFHHLLPPPRQQQPGKKVIYESVDADIYCPRIPFLCSLHIIYNQMSGGCGDGLSASLFPILIKGISVWRCSHLTLLVHGRHTSTEDCFHWLMSLSFFYFLVCRCLGIPSRGWL